MNHELYGRQIKRVELRPGMSMADLAKAEGHKGKSPSMPKPQEQSKDTSDLRAKILRAIEPKPMGTRLIGMTCGLTEKNASNVLYRMRAAGLIHTKNLIRGNVGWHLGPKPSEGV